MSLSLEKMYPKELRKIILPKGQGQPLVSDLLWQKVLSNLGLVGMVAGGYMGRGLSEDDLIQHGIIGLYKAVLRYKPELGSFSNYAVIKIRGEIAWALNENNRLAKISDRLREVAPDDPTPEPFESLQRKQSGEIVREGLDKLKERDRQVLEMRYGLNEDGPMSKQETGIKLGVTGEAIRQTEEKLLDRLKKSITRTRR